MAQDATTTEAAEAVTSSLPPVSLDPEAISAWGQLVLEKVIVYAPKIILALIVFAIGMKIARWLGNLTFKGVTKTGKIDETLGKFFSSVVRYLGVIATLMIVVSILGGNVAAILGIFAAATFAIGLALQGSMSNVAAGLMLIIQRPFTIGDYVEVAGQEGVVDDLNIFTTTLRTLDNIKTIIANGEVRGSTIKNLTVLGKRRVEVDFGIDYGDDMDKAIKIIKETAAKDSRVFKDPGPWAKVLTLNDSSVDIQMRVWCSADDYWDVMFDLTKDVKNAFDKAGISIPYPHCVEIVKRP